MKRTIKTLGLFLSAFFLLTGCSSDDEENYLIGFIIITAKGGKPCMGCAII